MTQVTYQREPWLCSEVRRKALREAIQAIRTAIALCYNSSDSLSCWRKKYSYTGTTFTMVHFILLGSTNQLIQTESTAV